MASLAFQSAAVTWWLAILLIGVVFVTSSSAALEADRLRQARHGKTDGAPPNVLFFGVDDLRPELTSFGYDFMHTPSITRLAGMSEGGQSLWKNRITDTSSALVYAQVHPQRFSWANA